MARLLFAHDHRFGCHGGRYFSLTGGLNDAVFERYFELANHITVLARIRNVDVKAGLTEVSSDAVEFFDAGSVGGRGIVELVRTCDLVVVRLPSLVGLNVARIAHQQGKPYFAEVVGCAWDALWNHGLRGKAIAPFMEVAVQQAVRHASHALYVTERFLQSKYPSLGAMAGVSDVECIPAPAAVLQRRLDRLGRGLPRPCVIGTTAAVDVRYKGQQHVIRALRLLKGVEDRTFEYQMVGAGDSGYLQAVARDAGVADQVSFLGSLPRSKVLEWLDRIDVYIQPSRQEGLPRAVVEAMSRGVPCLGSKAGGIPELLPASRLFDVGRGMPASIAAMLEGLSTQELVDDVRRNHHVSHKYELGVLAAERRAFMFSYRARMMGAPPMTPSER